jgi:hypothetical protein
MPIAIRSTHSSVLNLEGLSLSQISERKRRKQSSLLLSGSGLMTVHADNDQVGRFHSLTSGPFSPRTGSVFGSFTAGIVFNAFR